jgi:hypothetical protein
MTDGTVTPIRRGQHAYTDTAALNDIHALLTSTDLGADTLADIAAIVARTSRALVPVRDIETSSTETVLGWPVACVDAGETTVFVPPGHRRDRAGGRNLHPHQRRAGRPGRHPRRPPPPPGRAVPGPGRLTHLPQRKEPS